MTIDDTNEDHSAFLASQKFARCGLLLWPSTLLGGSVRPAQEDDYPFLFRHRRLWNIMDCIVEMISISDWFGSSAWAFSVLVRNCRFQANTSDGTPTRTNLLKRPKETRVCELQSGQSLLRPSIGPRISNLFLSSDSLA